VWREHLLKGLLLLFFFFIFILRFAYWNGVMTSSLTLPSSTLWRGIFWGGLFILFYFLSIRKIVRLKPRFETDKQGAITLHGKSF